MFDFLFQNKNEDMQSYMDIISVEVKKLQLSKLAIQKAVGMIAHAIAKSEFVVQREGGRAKDHIYWLLNIRPNSNETATDFWIDAIQRLLTEGECLICYVADKLYIVDAYTADSAVIMPRIYKNITIISNGETFRLDKNFRSDEIIHLRAQNKKIVDYLKNVLKMYNDTASALAAAKKISGTPKFSLDIPGQLPVIRTKDESGKEKTLTIDEYKKSIKKLLESDDIEVLLNQNGMSVSQMKIDTGITSEDLVKMATEIFTECAMAFDIPKAVFLGEITEKADSTNEFITYCAGWVKEILEDSLNAKLVGEKDYLKGEKIWIDMSKFKHRDIIESAANLDKLRSIGFNFDEIRTAVGWEELNTDFSQERVITKNYTNDLGGEGSGTQNADT